jgi:hypothetical protein
VRVGPRRARRSCAKSHYLRWRRKFLSMRHSLSAPAQLSRDGLHHGFHQRVISARRYGAGVCALYRTPTPRLGQSCSLFAEQSSGRARVRGSIEKNRGEARPKTSERQRIQKEVNRQLMAASGPQQVTLLPSDPSMRGQAPAARAASTHALQSSLRGRPRSSRPSPVRWITPGLRRFQVST